ncbi:unnamed protein product [Somion occarium]|uniref:Gag protein n=1 Tax=Somion occarium TaxID=3059160 RepID=A0ABP1D430_9APHY
MSLWRNLKNATQTHMTLIIKKDWKEAFHLLEALTIWQDGDANSWPMCDDGERTHLTARVFGAEWVTVVRGLKAQGILDTEHFPNLETLLEMATNWGDSMNALGDQCSPYPEVLRGIGRRLFKDKPADVIALETAREEEWIKSLHVAQQERVRENKKEMEEENEGAKPWYEEGSADEDLKDRHLTLSTNYKRWKDYLKDAPTMPLRGPPTWDLTEWTAEERAQFSFDQSDDSESEID